MLFSEVLLHHLHVIITHTSDDLQMGQADLVLHALQCRGRDGTTALATATLKALSLQLQGGLLGARARTEPMQAGAYCHHGLSNKPFHPTSLSLSLF